MAVVAVAVLGVLLVAAHLGEILGRAPGLVRSYLDDLLFLPVVLSVALVVHRRAGAGPRWTLPAGHGLVAAVLTGVLFEWVLPGVFARGVGDPRDLLAYLAGWGIFTLLVNRPAGGSSPAGAREGKPSGSAAGLSPMHSGSGSG